MNIAKIVQSLMLVSVVLCVLSCSKPDDEEVLTTPFIANFTNEWLAEGGEGFIVISDLQGQALQAATWSGDTTIQFELASDSRIIVTTGTLDASSNTVSLTSNCYVNPGEWTWKGKPKSTLLGSVTLNFINQPVDLVSGWLAGVYYKRNIYDFSSPISCPVYAQQEHLYLCCDDGSEVYLLIEDITPGNTVNVDLASLTATEDTGISFHQTTAQYFIDWQGYQVPGQYYQGSFHLLQHEEFGENADNGIGFGHAAETTHFRTQFVHFDSPEHWSGDYWSFYDYGPVPSNTEKIDADFEIINSNPDNFKIDISGTVDNVQSNWEGSSGYKQVEWRVFTHPDYTEFELPRMPDSIAVSFYLPYTPLYTLKDVRIIDYPDLDSHEEVIETLFQSDDYFFNIATGGFRMRTKQNSNLTKTNMMAARDHNDSKVLDPMIPIP